MVRPEEDVGDGEEGPTLIGDREVCACDHVQKTVGGDHSGW